MTPKTVTAAVLSEAETHGLRVVARPDGGLQIQWPKRNWVLNADLTLGVTIEPGFSGVTLAGKFSDWLSLLRAVVRCVAALEAVAPRTDKQWRMNPVIRSEMSSAGQSKLKGPAGRIAGRSNGVRVIRKSIGAA